MRIYSFLEMLFPGSYAAKFHCILIAALVVPVLTALLVPVRSQVGAAALLCSVFVTYFAAQRAISALLGPVARVSAFLRRVEAGHRVRPLPEGCRDELGLLMESANRLSVQHQRQLDEAARDADQDPLTGLLNRRGMERRFPALKPSSAVLLIDLDHFRTLNDTHGHAVGDGVLVRVADMLSAAFRHDDLLARIGGEAFLACLPGATLEQARQAAERVRIVLEDRPLLEGEAVTASIGVACGQRGDSVRQLMEAADQALLRAKAAGRNRVVCAGAVPAQCDAPALRTIGIDWSAHGKPCGRSFRGEPVRG